MAININSKSATKKASKAEKAEQNLTAFEAVAPHVTCQSVTFTFTDDETGETYEAEAPVGGVINTSPLKGGDGKSEGFWYGGTVVLNTPHGEVRFNPQGNCFVSGSKDAKKARAAKAARKKAAEAQRE